MKTSLKFATLKGRKMEKAPSTDMGWLKVYPTRLSTCPLASTSARTRVGRTNPLRSPVSSKLSGLKSKLRSVSAPVLRAKMRRKREGTLSLMV
jgi:hypothetical protein